MSETSPTEGDGNTGSANADLPENTNQNQSADEQQTDSVSSGSQDTDQNDNNQPSGDSTTGDDSSSSDDNSSDDDGLASFAKGQGIDNLDDLTERERKLLKTAHDNQKAFRTTKQQQTDELKDTITDVNTVDDSDLEELDPTEARELERDSRMARLEAKERANEYFLKNSDAREYESEMAQVIAEEAQANGKDAARYLASNLDRVLILAKARRGMSEESVRADAAREERERLRQRQEGSADSGQATSGSSAPKKVTREEIAQMDDATYEEFKKSGGLQAAIERGDLY